MPGQDDGAFPDVGAADVQQSARVEDDAAGDAQRLVGDGDAALDLDLGAVEHRGRRPRPEGLLGTDVEDALVDAGAAQVDVVAGQDQPAGQLLDEAEAGAAIDDGVSAFPVSSASRRFFAPAIVKPSS